MKHTRSFSLLLTTIALAACTETTTSVADVRPELAVTGVGHQALGSGHVQTAAGLREFTFHATERLDGSVRGSYKVVLPNGLFLESDVTCLSVAGSTGWVGGVVRASNAAGVVIGSTSMFYAIDGGEGGEAADVVSVVGFNRAVGDDQAFCREQPLELAPQTVTDGNVQVR